MSLLQILLISLIGTVGGIFGFASLMYAWIEDRWDLDLVVVRIKGTFMGLLILAVSAIACYGISVVW